MAQSTPQPVISVKNLKKEFSFLDDRPKNIKEMLVRLSRGALFAGRRHRHKVLDGVSFDIFPGEIVGIMGRNGTGKSTLLRLLCGIYSPDSGKITVTQKVAALVGLGAGFHTDLTGYENIFLNAAVIGFGRAQIHKLAEEIIEFSELGEQIRMPVRNYSSGMVMRLGFSIAAHVDAPILLLDEILGVGDEGFQAKSLQKLLDLMRSGRTVVLITHDARSILSHCTRCIVLEKGQLIFDGLPADGVNAYSALFLPQGPQGGGHSLKQGPGNEPTAEV